MHTFFGGRLAGLLMEFALAGIAWVALGMWFRPEEQVPAPQIATPYEGEGLRVGRDPGTGALRQPTAPARLQAAPETKPAENPPAWRLRDGGFAMRAPAYMTSYSVIRMEPGGTREYACLDGPAATQAWMAGEKLEGARHEH